MQVKQVFVMAACIAVAIATLCKLAYWWIVSDPATFGIGAFRALKYLQIAIDVGLIAAVSLICLGLLGQRPANPVSDRRRSVRNPFDEPTRTRR